ncbi:hypothetical protein EYF80_041019 [Liparis tanakae]|uniref:Uncharacterized protein n=1 Tax=Liparis tanakae TaxID=230148 RepID=A0A4Z2G6K5_9TELE|nr:hypothetical protein EYF80_041019 [Liparis tanakae]
MVHLVSPILQRRQQSVQDEELARGLHQLFVNLQDAHTHTQVYLGVQRSLDIQHWRRAGGDERSQATAWNRTDGKKDVTQDESRALRAGEAGRETWPTADGLESTSFPLPRFGRPLGVNTTGASV